MTAIKVALKKIKGRRGDSWVIYTDSQSSMQAIESNKENHPILNQIYDILADLKGQKKHITLCKVPAHTGIKGNEEADKAAKEATDMPGVITTRLLPNHKESKVLRMAEGMWKPDTNNQT